MSADLEAKLRTSASYDLAHEAVEVMRRHAVWPTPLAFELCLHYIAEPESPLGCAIQALVSAGQLTTEDWSDKLAREFLPRLRLQDEVSDAGEALNRELENIGAALSNARGASQALDQTLKTADLGIAGAQTLEDVRAELSAVSQASDAMQRDNATLEKRLAESSAEIEQLREHMQRIRREAMTDPLTLLANRRAFEQHLDRACAEADVDGRPLTLALIDIDHFKSFNDTWGHQTGDQVIRYVGRVLAGAGTPPRIAARQGGEEFALILPREHAAAALQVMERFRVEIASRVLKRRTTGDDLGSVTVSIGIAERRVGEKAGAFVERADQALYASKRTGRNRTTVDGAVGQAKAVEQAA